LFVLHVQRFRVQSSKVQSFGLRGFAKIFLVVFVLEQLNVKTSVEDENELEDDVNPHPVP
jgi:hypothetical protein